MVLGTTDRSQPDVVLTIRSNIIPGIDIAPESLLFKDTIKGRDLEEIVQITTALNGEDDIVELISNVPQIKITLTDKKRERRMMVALDLEFMVRRYKIQIKTNGLEESDNILFKDALVCKLGSQSDPSEGQKAFLSKEEVVPLSKCGATTAGNSRLKK